MFVRSGFQRRWTNHWGPFGVSFFLFFLLARLTPVTAQVEGNSHSEGRSPEQLRKTAESYEDFLRAPLAPGTPRSKIAETQAQLGAVYFLLHRYRDSLDVLRPVLREQQTSKASETEQAGRSKAVSLQAQSWLVSGLDHLELNEATDAIAALRHALAMQPKNANARLALGDALARSGRMEDAAKEYAAQTKLTPSLPDAWYKLGLADSQLSVEIARSKVKEVDRSITQQLNAEELMAKGDNLNGARILFRLMRQARAQPEVHGELGTTLLALGYAKAAEDHFHQEIATDPESPQSHLGLAQTAALRGDWAEVSGQLQYLSKSQPRELTRLLEFPPAGLILQAWNGGQLKPSDDFAQSAAGTLWKSWLTESGVSARISLNGDQESQNACSGSTPRAMEEPGMWLTQPCYESLVRRLRLKKELSVAMRAKLAEAKFRLGQYDDALRAAELLHDADRRSGWGIYWLSKSHDAIAEDCFLNVASLNPDSPRVHQMLAEHYAKLSEYPKAKAEYLSALRSAPDLPDLHLGLGTVLSRTGGWAEAERELKTTLQLAPESDFAHYQLGHAYLQQSLWLQAIEQLRKVSPSSTVLLSARLDLAKAESQTGQITEAIQNLLSVTGLDQDGEVYFDLAADYRKLDDRPHAREALATFKKLRAASLQTDGDELSALEKEQTNKLPESPQR
jgi:tetratricopeptide (TPR) repeat protein